MKIGELAGRTELNASALRYYERCGLISASHRIGGQRRYPGDIVYRVMLICFAGDMGFTLDEIKLLEEFAADVALGMAFVDKSKQAEYLAYNDPLTGLPNRVRFLERIAMHASGTASGAEFGVMLLDLDRFRSINDTHGPAAGDEAKISLRQGGLPRHRTDCRR